MTVGTYGLTDHLSDDPTDYKVKIDNNFAVLQAAAQFSVHENVTPDMQLLVEPGMLLIAGQPVVKPIQTTPVFTAPATNNRIDRVVLDTATGDIAILTGTEDVSPVAPLLEETHLPLAQVLLTPATTFIVNTALTDERVVANSNLGTASSFNVGTEAGNIIQLDSQAKLPSVDGSNLTNLTLPPIPTVDDRQLANAFVNFNGQGTVSIRNSFNVSSVSDYGTGQYGVNFATPMPNTNYCFLGWCRSNTTDTHVRRSGARSNDHKTTSSVRVYVSTSSSSLQDVPEYNLIAFA